MPYELNDNGLTINGTLTHDEWLRIGTSLQYRFRGVQFAVGDWLAYGETQREWGNIYKEAEERFEVPAGTLAQWKRVSNAIPPCKRLHELSWSHHHMVASAPAETRDRLLKLALDKQMTVAKLKKEVEVSHLPQDFECLFTTKTEEMIELLKAFGVPHDKHMSFFTRSVGGLLKVAGKQDPRNMIVWHHVNENAYDAWNEEHTLQSETVFIAHYSRTKLSFRDTNLWEGTFSEIKERCLQMVGVSDPKRVLERFDGSSDWVTMEMPPVKARPPIDPVEAKSAKDLKMAMAGKK